MLKPNTSESKLLNEQKKLKDWINENHTLINAISALLLTFITSWYSYLTYDFQTKLAIADQRPYLLSGSINVGYNDQVKPEQLTDLKFYLKNVGKTTAEYQFTKLIINFDNNVEFKPDLDRLKGYCLPTEQTSQQIINFDGLDSSKLPIIGTIDMEIVYNNSLHPNKKYIIERKVILLINSFNPLNTQYVNEMQREIEP